jgi:hypothetical protein
LSKIGSLKFSVVFSAVLAIGAGACVADDPSTSARVLGDEVTAMNVVNEILIPTVGEDNIDPRVVVIAGLDYPGRAPLQPNIDLKNVDSLTLDPNVQAVCAQVNSLPTSDVCSSLCDPDAFAARVLGGGNGCTSQTCELPDGTRADVDVCN